MSCPEGVAKKALRSDDLGTPVAKKGFRSDGGRGRFARGSAKPQVTDGLFSAEEIIHFAIVTAGALFGHVSSLPRPFLASALPNPSPRSHFLALLAKNPFDGDGLGRWLPRREPPVACDALPAPRAPCAVSRQLCRSASSICPSPLLCVRRVNPPTSKVSKNNSGVLCTNTRNATTGRVWTNPPHSKRAG